jgi:hypothetical protein
MKKILSKKLQVRSSTIANLTGPDLKIVQGGVTGPTDGAGVTSIVDGTKHMVCNVPITNG